MRDAIVAEARSWIDTPYVHAGRVKGVGVDCVQLVVACGLTAGMADPELPSYGFQPDSEVMMLELQKHLNPVPFRKLLPADLILFRSGGTLIHVGIVSQLYPMAFLHAFNKDSVMKVVEIELGDFWRKKIAGCFRFRGL